MSDEIVKKLNLTPAQPKEKTKSDLLWDKIKNVKLNLFGLPNQSLQSYLKPCVVEPNKLYLELLPHKKAVTAIVSALDEALVNYNFEVVDKYYVVSEK